METKDSTEKRCQDDIEPFPSVPGVPYTDHFRKGWGVVVNHLIKKEKDRCDIWKEEVENLTVYAGLFSAVVAAFIVESSKALQDSPSDILLSRIVVALERSANITGNTTTSPPNSSSITSANKIVNALWFLSLVLSLSSALIGLVGLQWIREHLRSSTLNVPLKTLPAIVQMQADSLDAYYVPQTFTALPLLLIISITLFFVGLIQYLWNINHTVAYPSIITISLILAFILYTTIRPGLQGLPDIGTARFRSSKSIPAIPCPYRSPQSWALLHIVVFLSLATSFLRRRLYSRNEVSDALTPTKKMKNWIDWLVVWPRIRDIDQLRSAGDKHSLLQSFRNKQLIFPPIYDTVRALSCVKEDFSLMGSDAYGSAMEQACVSYNDFVMFRQGSQGFATQLIGHVHEVLDEPFLPLSLPKDFISQASPERQKAHAKLLFVTSGVKNLNDLYASLPDSTTDGVPDLLRFTCENLGTKIDISKPFGSPIALSWYRATNSFFGGGNQPEIWKRKDLEHVTQFAGIVNLIIEYSAHLSVEESPDSLGTSPYVKTLLHAIANIIVSRASPNWPAKCHMETTQVNDGLLTNIKFHLQNRTPNPYLFLLSSIYTHFLLVEVSPLFQFNPVYARTQAYHGVAHTLRQQHSELCNDMQLRQYQEWIFPASLKPGFKWAYLDPQYGQVPENADESAPKLEVGLSMPSRSKSHVIKVATQKEDNGCHKQEASAVVDVVEKSREESGSVNLENLQATGRGRGDNAHEEGPLMEHIGKAAQSSSDGLLPKQHTSGLGLANAFNHPGTRVDAPEPPNPSPPNAQTINIVPQTSVASQRREDHLVIETIGSSSGGDAIVEMGTNETAEPKNIPA